MFQSRLLNALAAFGFVIGMGCGADAGCGCDMQPLPGGTLPADQTIEGGMQVRVTRTGFDNIENVVRALIADQFGDGLCVGKVGAGIFVADVEACYENRCSGGGQGCQVNVTMDQIDMTVPNSSTFRVHVVMDVNTVIDARLLDPIFGAELASCDLGVTLNDGDITLDIGFFIDPTTGELGIQLQDIDLDLNGFNSSGCSFISSILDFVVDVLSGPLGGFIIDLLVPVIDDLIAGFLPDPLGLEGMLDVGALIGSISPGTSATLETKIIPGGYVSLPAEGLSLGVITGFNADEDITTRTPDLDSEPAFCVPPFSAPDFAAAPHNLTRSSRNQFQLQAAQEFLGAPDPANDLVIGLSETFLDLTGHHIVSSGALCLGVGTELIPQLNLGLIGLLVPSLAELGSDSGEDPLMLILRPTKPLDFSIGTGTEEDPSITIHFEDLDVDFYAFLFERFVRGFSIRLTMDVGINLTSTVDDEGNPALEPQIVGLAADSITLTVHNSEFLREDASTLEQVLPSIFDLALPLISDGIGAITLPDINGFTLSDIDITKVTTSEDDFLALYATLVTTGGMAAVVGEHNVKPGGQLEQLIARESARLPVRVPVDTVARLVSVTVPKPDAIRTWMANAGGALPEVVIELDPTDPNGRELEWTWRHNGGFWHMYSRDTELRIAERAFGWQGHHTIEVKARAVGEPQSVDFSPVKFDILIDSSGPRIHTRSIKLEGDNLVVTANDLVTPEGILFAFAAGANAAEPDTEWMPVGKLNVAAAKALTVDGQVTVFAKDALGNVSTSNVDTGALIGFHGRAEGGGGCECDASGGNAAGTWLAALMLFGLFGLSRRDRRARVRKAAKAASRWLPMVALLLAVGFAGPGCSCSSDAGSGPACEIDVDCQASCGAGEIGICFNGECLCADDVPLGTIGQYSDLSLSSSGVAWVSAYNSRHGDLMVARWPDTGPIADEAWEFVDGVPAGPIALPDSDVRGGVFEAGEDVGLFTSIAVSPADVVNVAYFDATNASLKFATNVNGLWENHTIEKGSGVGDPELGYEIVGQYNSITLNPTDARPGIAYFAQISEGVGTIRTELRFASAGTATPSSAGDWTTFVVDEVTVALPEPTDGEADPFLIPEGVGLFVSSTRAPDGTPVLAYYDRVNGDLKLARFDGVAGTWSTQVLDGASTDVGWYPSVGVDSEGVAHVSYLSATSDDLVYINSANATPETVDDGYRIDGTTSDGLPQPVFHFVGDDSSIVLTNAGPIIAYQDATTHELLLAQRNAMGNWEHTTVAGDEDPFVGGYGFYAAAKYDGTQIVMSSWVIDQPGFDAWVEVFRHTVVVQ